MSNMTVAQFWNLICQRNGWDPGERIEIHVSSIEQIVRQAVDVCRVEECDPDPEATTAAEGLFETLFTKR